MSDIPTSAALGPRRDSVHTVPSQYADIRGRKVVDCDGRTIGRVQDLLLDEREHVRFLLVDHAGFLGVGGKRTLLPSEDITAVDVNHVHVDHTGVHVAAGPEYDPKLMARPGYLESVHSHYEATPHSGDGSDHTSGVHCSVLHPVMT